MKQVVQILVAVSCLVGMTSCQNGAQMPWQQPAVPPPPGMMDGGLAPMPPPVAPTDPGLQLSTQQRFRDVPLPVGVKEDFDRSYVYESSALQIGRMVYTSRAEVNDLANFYIKEAPLGGWQLQSAMQAQGGQTLLFTKPGKRLEVRVQEQGVGRSRLLILSLTPEGPGF
jgi:hypothetical protein